MAVDMIAPDGVTQYVRQTQRRISQLEQSLDFLRQGQDQDLNSLAAQLGEQEQASRDAGFIGIARLIHDMSDCLQWTAKTERWLSTGTIGALLDACQCIVLHAEAVEAGVYPVHLAREQ